MTVERPGRPGEGRVESVVRAGSGRAGREARVGDRGAAVAARLREEIGGDAFERYLGRGARLEMDDEGLRVTVSSRFAADMIRERFGEAMRRAVSACTGGAGASVRYDVRPSPGEGERGGERAGRAAAVAPAARPARRPRSEADPRTLGSFVVGAANRLAHEAARRVVEDDGAGLTSPLFIHGACGVGKTHLLAGIAAGFGARFPGARVRFVSAEAFTNEYIRAVRSNRVESFHRAYRKIDLLCLDDVHFLAKKSGTQTELLHTFDTLDLHGARVVLASDNHPRQIKPFSDALISRFVSGSLVKIEAPDPVLRRRMVASFASRAGLRLVDGAAEILADGAVGDGPNGAPSVRDLQGLVNRVLAYVRLSGDGGRGTVDSAVASAVLRSSCGGGEAGHESGRPARPVPIERILDSVCETLGVTREDLAGRGRARAVVLGRSLVAVLARRLTRRSYPEIAAAMGRSNHSTVITAHRRIEGQIERGERVAAGLHFDGMTIGTLAGRIERGLRSG